MCFDSSCLSCSAYGPQRCLSCGVNFVVKGQCYNECPIPYVSINGVCSINGDLQIIFESPVGFYSVPQLDFLSSGSDSVQAFQRGTFFSQNSYFSTQPYFTPPSYTIYAWLRLVSGTLSGIGFSGKLSFISDFSNILIQQSFISTSLPFPNSKNWNIITYSYIDHLELSTYHNTQFLDIYGSHIMLFYVYINRNLAYSLTTTNTDTMLSRTKASLIIFTDDQSSMFVYYFRLVTGYSYVNDFTSVDGCIFIINLASGCLGTCDVNQYAVAGGCASCSSQCKSCVKSNSCNLCMNNCNNCLSYTDACCAVTVNGACYSNCPLLFDNVNNICIEQGSGSLIFNLNTFTGEIKNIGSGVMKLMTYTGRNYPNFNSILDPSIGFNRGFYFHQLSPLAYLKSNIAFLMSNQLCLSFWLSPDTFSGFFYKSTISLTLTSSGLSVFFYSPTDFSVISSYTTTFFPISLSTWYFFAISITYSSGNTKADLYINSQSALFTVTNNHIYDSYGIMNVGISKGSAITFKGWIFSISYYPNYLNSDSVLSNLGSCNGCNCPAGGDCLWTCPVGSYFSFGKCRQCSSIDYCKDITDSLCFDSSCIKCSNYQDCTTCGNLCYNLCYTLCAKCSGGGPFQCIACDSGSAEFNLLCLPKCPGLFSLNTANECVNQGVVSLKYNFHSFSTSFTDALGILVFLPVPSGSIVAYARGSYVPTFQQSEDFVFTPFFAVTIWIRLGGFSNILTKGTEFNIFYNSDGLYTSAFMLTQTFSLQCETGTLIKTWASISVAYSKNKDFTVIKVFVNGVLLNSASYKAVYLQSTGSNHITLGDARFSSFIYEFLYYTDPNDVLSSLKSCSNCKCPVSLGICLWDCEATFYYDGTKCQACNGTCSTCRYANDCSLCAVKDCNTCTDLISNSCGTCKTGLVFQRGICCNNCDLCYSKCSGCSSASPFACTGCLITAVSYNGKCLDQCPVMCVNINGVCSGSGGDLVYNFDSFDEGTQDNLGVMRFVNYVDVPVFSPSRGKFISVVSQYESIVIAPFVTLELWIMLFSPGSILTKANSITQDLSISLASSGNIEISFTSTGSISSNSIKAIIPFKSWMFLGISLQEGQGSTELYLYLNNIQLAHITLSASYLINSNLTTLHLGNSLTKSFIYHFTYTSFGKSQTEVQKSIGSCSTCTCPASINSCLWPCLLNEYFNGTSCLPCLESCNTCRFRTSCTGCSNINCISCLTPSALTCATCVNNKNYTAFLQGKCECSKDYFVVDTDCVYCNRWVQSSDLTAMFSEDYLKVFVYFNISVIQVSCTEIFYARTIEKFGSDYQCSYLENDLGIEIVLGFGSTIEAGILSLNSVLKGQLPECGYLNTSISVQLQNSGVFPSPTAVIQAPDSIDSGCEDLVIQGFNSYGGVLSALLYQWKISSSTQDLSLYSTNASLISSLTVPYSSLIAGTVSATLTVFNKYKNSDSASAKIFISKTNSVAITFPSFGSFFCLVSSTCVYPIQNIISCDAAGSFNLTWKMIKGQDTLSPAKLNQFWELQSSDMQLIIVKNFFSPQILKFLITANDTKSEMYGEKVITVVIMPEKPAIILKPASGSISLTRDLILDASSSFDDNYSSVAYNWSCVYNGGKCNFTFSETNSVLNISMDQLNRYRFDYFYLSVRSIQVISRSLQSTVVSMSNARFTGYYVDFYTPIVYFRELITGRQPLIISSSKRFMLEAVVSGYLGIDYTYEWKINSDSPVILSKITEKFIIIDPSVLNKGGKYSLQFSLTDQIGHTSKFFYNFTTNLPPSSGSFTVYPQQGLELFTTFHCSAFDWVDFQGNYPLYYSFGYILKGYRIHLSTYSQTPSFRVKVPYVTESSGFFLKVFDSLGDYSLANASVKVDMNPEVNTSALLYQCEDIYQTAFTSELPGLIYLLSSSTLNRDILYKSLPGYQSINADLEKLHGCFNVTAKYLEKYIKLSVPSINLIDQSIDLMNATSLNRDIRSFWNLNTTRKLYVSLIEATNSLEITVEQTKRFFEVLGNSIYLNATTVYNGTQELCVLSSTIESVERALLVGMSLQQRKSAKSANISMDIIVINASDTNNFIFTSSDYSGAEISLSPHISSELSLNTSLIGISITHINATNVSELSTPTILSVAFYLLPEIILLNVSLTNSSFIDLRIPLSKVNTVKNLTCYFLNLTIQDWDTRGCQLRFQYKDYVICRCRHLSFFSAGEGTKGEGFWPKSNFEDTLDLAALTKINAKTAIGLYFCVCVLVIYVIIAIVTFRMDRKEYAKKLTRISTVGPVVVQCAQGAQDGGAIKLTDNEVEEIEIQEEKKAQSLKVIQEKDIIKSNSSYQMIFEQDEPKSCNVRMQNEEEDEAVNRSTRPFGDSELSEDESQVIWLILKAHKYLNVFIVFEAELPKFMRATLLFFSLLGNMYFTGLFYEGDGSLSITFRESLKEYTFSDFLVIVYSFSIMTSLEIVIEYLLSLKSLEKTLNFIEYLNQSWKRIKLTLGIAICWGLMAYFSWGISVFAIKFGTGVSYKWVFNTIINYIADILFLSFLVAYIKIKILPKIKAFFKGKSSNN